MVHCIKLLNSAILIRLKIAQKGIGLFTFDVTMHLSNSPKFITNSIEHTKSAEEIQKKCAKNKYIAELKLIVVLGALDYQFGLKYICPLHSKLGTFVTSMDSISLDFSTQIVLFQREI